jgi:hypothetical protein
MEQEIIMKMKVAGTALLISAAMIGEASAGFFRVVPVPEMDASSGVGAIALLASLAAIWFSKLRNK